jgi:hypothetical protein
VKAIVRRLRRLENQAMPIVNERGETLAEVVRQRRRRRLKAEGLPFDDRSRETFAGAQSLSEAIRMGRRRAWEAGRVRSRQSRQCAPIQLLQCD